MRSVLMICSHSQSFHYTISSPNRNLSQLSSSQFDRNSQLAFRDTKRKEPPLSQVYSLCSLCARGSYFFILFFLSCLVWFGFVLFSFRFFCFAFSCLVLSCRTCRCFVFIYKTTSSTASQTRKQPTRQTNKQYKLSFAAQTD